MGEKTIGMEDKILTKDRDFLQEKKKNGAEAMIKDRLDEKFSEPRRSGFVDKRVKFWII